ncbi:MAG TPA: methyltransferase domain-containing protein [Gaiella sp.]|uniref:class I SAM-dependent methyltransferase n=1 Tax=Gaiella sp. TaxID=2663207 RepID=UPI002D7EE207|nr:methyltransferase domain-containing protein [Gaiella sp.]HET9286106.1 methyltransferase domain-containing protein [Gaiella sp.]
MDDSSEQIAAWSAVAAGWERQRPLFWEATRIVSERLVDLLDPTPGETILDLAAGPGDTGFLALPRVRPGGKLLTTDGAPEMLEAARRRAAELALGDGEVSFAVEDAVALSLGDASVDGVLCRWGLMLLADMGAGASEIARVLRPGGRAAIAVWADPAENDWMTAPGRSAVELGLVERPDPESPGPFRLSPEGSLRSLLERAGLEVDVVEDVPLTWRAPTLRDWWDVARDTSRSLALILGRITPAEAEAVRAGAERKLERYVEPDGTLAVPGLARVALARPQS